MYIVAIDIDPVNHLFQLFGQVLQVIQFHETGIPSARYKFVEAFPVEMEPQGLNWGDDGIHRLQMTFHYRTYQREENVLKQLWSSFNTPTPKT